ncbi:MAG: hypothetical protein HC837_12375, partial [Chloroflexaceae bacterium]|nr:hypothetical protein [Chloroflexaceae bacterium]
TRRQWTIASEEQLRDMITVMHYDGDLDYVQANYDEHQVMLQQQTAYPESDRLLLLLAIS